jgi:hypothetical protein
VTTAKIVQRPGSFARVDMVKIAAYVNGTSTDPVQKGDDRLWILGDPLAINLLAANGDRIDTVIVPKGFVTDGASVPYLAQVLTGWRPWDEPQRWGAIAHDWLYCCNGRPVPGGAWDGHLPAASKRGADRAFRAALSGAGARWPRHTAMYWAVKLFGGHAYRTDQSTGPTIRT